MSQKLPVTGFKWVEETSQVNEHFIISYSEEIYKGYFIEVDAKYSEKLCDLYTKNKNWKVENLVANLRNNNGYVIQMRNLKQALKKGLVLKKGHNIIRFN